VPLTGLFGYNMAAQNQIRLLQTVDLDLLVAKYGGRVPRYTSYPTAVQFTPAVSNVDYRLWLESLPPEAGALSIYVHVPFCQSLCWYCGCHTGVVNSTGPVREYAAMLEAEIDLVADLLPRRFALAAVHFGGGTPNILPPAELGRLMDRLSRRFDMTADAEIAVEIDPRSLNKAWLATARSAGINRASLGVQDFDADVQAAINRPQPYELVADAVSMLRDADITSLNFDLLYGLPRQTIDTLTTTMVQAISLEPDRLSLFGYAHVPWLKPHQKLLPEAQLPDAATRFSMQRHAAELLEAAGFQRLGLDHFARPKDELGQAAQRGEMRRNFQGYTADGAEILLGFGASAISRLPQGYVQNEPRVPNWREDLARGELPIARGVALCADDRFRAEIIERLMCDFRVDLNAICARHGRSLWDLHTELRQLDEMSEDGLVALSGAELSVTRDGRDLVRSVCAVFDRHLDRTTARHSQGI
jgi:oxygen-independent coproporphyrinogen-3 oxidase